MRNYCRVSRKAEFKAHYLVILFFLGFVLSCAAVGKLNLISTRQELELGAQFSKEIEKQITIYPDPLVAAYIDSLGQLMAKNSKRTNIPYYIKVVDTDEVNAFAIPGGYLYVNRGLITTAESESELAGVMGHEIGHVVGRHGAKQLTKRLGLAVIVQVVAGGDPDLTRQLASSMIGVGGTLSLLKYGRDAEREADILAVHEMYASNIDPLGITTFFQKLLVLHDRKPGGVEKLFSTHPPTEDRIKKIKSQINRLPPKEGLVVDSPRFHTIKERILTRTEKERKTKYSTTNS